MRAGEGGGEERGSVRVGEDDGEGRCEGSVEGRRRVGRREDYKWRGRCGGTSQGGYDG